MERNWAGLWKYANFLAARLANFNTTYEKNPQRSAEAQARQPTVTGFHLQFGFGMGPPVGGNGGLEGRLHGHGPSVRLQIGVGFAGNVFGIF